MRHSLAVAAANTGVFDNLRVLISLLFVHFAFLGARDPVDEGAVAGYHGHVAGIASALGVTLQKVAGDIITGVAGAVLRRYLTANGRNGRCDLRGRSPPQPSNCRRS
jgi:hypothetical protein